VHDLKVKGVALGEREQREVRAADASSELDDPEAAARRERGGRGGGGGL
jgi:hypothetical protein